MIDNPHPQWYKMDVESALDQLETGRNGLSRDIVDERRRSAGPNALEIARGRSAPAIFADQFKDFMIGVLIVAAIVSAFIGEVKDTVVILVIVLLNAIIGFVQENRAKRAMEALRDLSAPSGTVIRAGEHSIVPAAELVPGDIVVVESGSIVPADMRLIEVAGLTADESMLTGESVPVHKTTELIDKKRVNLADQSNIAFSGTIATTGRAVGVVIAIGKQSQIGQIAGLVSSAQSRTPLQSRLAYFGRTLALAVIAISAIIFMVGVVRGEDVPLMLLTAISLAVAAIPEALPAVVTISLALGAQQLVKKGALVRKLPAVETLGSVTYICSDKTGTLTQNRMTATKAYVYDQSISVGQPGPDGALGLGPEDPRVSLLLEAAALCNNAVASKPGEPEETVIGDPTEVALAQLAASAHGDRPERVAEFPFDAERKRMTTIHRRSKDEYVSFTKGAYEMLSERLTQVWHSDGARPMGGPERRAIDAAGEQLASSGLRVLALTCKFWTEIPALEVDLLESDLIFLGFVGLLDPARPEAAEAVRRCRHAGITPVMITGDHPLTAMRIAEDLGIAQPGSPVITGEQLYEMTVSELEGQVAQVRVYARVSPEQKIKIVEALQGRNELVAMTGDGVNDAPALRKADIGVAMGRGGTDVAKEASDLVLLDDNFATIVNAIEGGRRIYDNIRRFIKYTMTSNSAEIWVMFLAPFLGLPLPLLPIHILWINLVTDGLPGLALASEPVEADALNRPPRDPHESIFSRGLWQHMLWVGLLMAGVSLFSQALYLGDERTWRTVIFSVLGLSQMGHALAVRSENESLFRQGLFTNRFLLFSVVLTFALQLLIIYTAPLQSLFRTAPLAPADLAVVLLLSSIVFIAVEAEKTLRRRRERSRGPGLNSG